MTVGKPKTAEMHPGPGFRIRYRFDRPPGELVAGLGEFDTPDVSDLMNRLHTMVPAIRNLTGKSLKILGPAFTVKVYPGDNLMVHKSLDLVEPGDVIVVDAGASPMNGIIGDLISTKARHRGVAGFVVDGLIRDIPEIHALGDFPVYARGISPIGPLHRGPGEINYPISAGGQVVYPGDIVLGDSNGVVIVPQEVAEELLGRLRDRAEREAEYRAAVQRGEFSNEWVDHLLFESGVPPEEPEASR